MLVKGIRLKKPPFFLFLLSVLSCVIELIVSLPYFWPSSPRQQSPNKTEATSLFSVQKQFKATQVFLNSACQGDNSSVVFVLLSTFSNMFISVCFFRDLRGNKFECDCKAKWLFLWLKMTNSTVSDVLCIGPAEYQDKKLNDVTSFDYEYFVVHQILPYQSVSVDTFNSKNDVFVAIAQPSMENCMVLEWDHIEMNFRSYDNITGQSIVGCKAILVGDQVFVVVAQLFGGSHIYKYDESWTKFVKFQDIEVSRISKPNDIELFEIDSEMFFVIADSSKAGLSTVYKWNNKGFYSYQSLHEWFRDTDAEFLDIDGKSHLILSSRSQVPIILQWNKASKKFVPHSEIPNMEDVLAVKSFRMQDNLYITLTRFIGDSRVMKWNSKQFVEIQALPSRGAMTLQPFSFKNNYYLALGSDYTFSQIYQWDGEKKIFRLFKEIYVQAPRSFTAVSTDRRDFFFASSFKGNTQIFEHILIDLSL
uniref:Leucine rich repeat LGI family member 2 n=1 Tax=Amazona collaria TaxID=241587 RepID=A0A8B9IV19_9PSIT